MKVTLITGASGGIGEALARRFAEANVNLFLVARSNEKLKILSEQLSRENNVKVFYQSVDLTEIDAAQRIWGETVKLGLEVDCLVNNAGIGTAGEFSKIVLEDELKVIQLNNIALVSLTYCFLPQMKKEKTGTVINVASMAAFLPCPFMAVYAASKVFVKSFTEAIAEEVKPENIRVMLLCPGATETNFFNAAKMDEQDKKALLGGATIQTPDMVADEAMRALQTKKLVAISGFANKLTATLSNLMPTSFLTGMIAKTARPHYQNNIQ